MRNRNFRKRGLAAAAGAMVLCMALGFGGAMAYFSGNAETVSNTYKVVAGSQNESEAGEIKEPNWTTEKDKDENNDGIKDVMQLMPGQTFQKDPSLKSGVDYPAYAYIRVKIPAVSAVMNGKNDASVQDAVVPEYDTDNWTLVKKTVSTKAGTSSEYVYRYNTALTPAGTTGDQTGNLFETVTVQNFKSITEEQAAEASIDVAGVLIQVDGFTVGTESANGTADTEALSIFSNLS